MLHSPWFSGMDLSNLKEIASNRFANFKKVVSCLLHMKNSRKGLTNGGQRIICFCPLNAER